MTPLMLVLSDIIILYVSLVVTLVVRYGTSRAYDQLVVHQTPFLLVFCIWLLALFIANLYDPRGLRNRRDFFEALLQTSIAATVVSMVFFYAVPSFGIAPRTNLLLFAAIVSGLLAASRYLFNFVLAETARRRTVLVGTDPESMELARTIRDNPQLGYIVSGVVRVGQTELVFDEADEFPVLDDEATLREHLADHDIDTIVISPEAYGSRGIIENLVEVIGRGMTFVDLPSFSERLTGKVPVGAINQVWFLEHLGTGRDRLYAMNKRVLDVVISIVLGLPSLIVFPLVALAIRSESRGPVIFSQTRNGQNGLPFRMLKFRTMREDAEKMTGAVWAMEQDPRVTRVGRFLRRSRIDEIPQLWNILRGQMSLVGPRAERPEFDAKLVHEVPFYNQRYLVKPGLSGWAQIKYRYGASVQDSTEKLQYDLYYIKHRSLLLDLEIILKTIAISLRQAGR